mmetsp:Transcript_15247/g.46037  ORF Transcript_15247/g.46037 Transcript_15247/m.46037 type:complete len:87 (-) Transcript_15247:200-460(-)
MKQTSYSFSRLLLARSEESHDCCLGGVKPSYRISRLLLGRTEEVNLYLSQCHTSIRTVTRASAGLSQIQSDGISSLVQVQMKLQPV